MTEEIVSEVKVLDSGKLLLVLRSGGDDFYQYVYREAAGVYWEPSFQQNQRIGLIQLGFPT